MEMKKSLVLKGPENFEIMDLPVPVPKPNEVLVEVAAASICHTDFVFKSGQYTKKRFPTILGHEFSGRVISCGDLVTNVRIGNNVTAMSYSYCGACMECRIGRYTACEHHMGIPMDMDGAFQQMIVVPENMVFRIPDSLNLEEAALTEPAANGFAAVEMSGIRPGETVVIIGPGPIGLLALQEASRRLPCSLIMLGTRRERLELAGKLGATEIVNINEHEPYGAIMDITAGKGADVVLFCGGGQNAWELAGRILKPFGRVVVEALPEPYNSKWPVPVCDFTEKNISYLGVSGYSPGQFVTTLQLMEKGVINVAPLITHRFRLEDYMEAFDTSEKRYDGAIKVVIKPNG